MAQMCVTCTTGRVHVNVNNLACQGIKDNLITIANLLALDSFLYEEETYNYWGHTENELITLFPPHLACLQRRMNLFVGWYNEKVKPLMERYRDEVNTSESED